MFDLLGLAANSPEEFGRHLANLRGLVHAYLETGRFSEIADVYDRVRTHALSGACRDEAGAMLRDFFGSDPFIEGLTDAFTLWGRHHRDGVVDLSIRLKEHTIPALLNALAESDEATGRRFLIDILCRIGNDVLPHAVARLEDTRWFVVRNMLYLIREGGGAPYVRQIRQLTRHHDERVAMEAVRTLLHFGAPDALSYVRMYLKSEEPELREQAARLAGAYKLRDAVPYLIELLEATDLFGTKAHCRIALVHALGEIGDPRSISVLQKIVRTPVLLNKAENERLKVEIFKSLQGYPPDAAAPILQLGLKSGNREIKAIADRLNRTGGGRRG